MKRSLLKRGTSTLKKSSTLKKQSAKMRDPKYLLDRQQQREDDWVFYEMVWEKKGPYSEISGEYLGPEVNKACIHHIIPKSKWKEGRYIENNCILMTIQEHANVENDIYKYEEVNKRRKSLQNILGIPE